MKAGALLAALVVLGAAQAGAEPVTLVPRAGVLSALPSGGTPALEPPSWGASVGRSPGSQTIRAALEFPPLPPGEVTALTLRVTAQPHDFGSRTEPLEVRGFAGELGASAEAISEAIGAGALYGVAAAATVGPISIALSAAAVEAARSGPFRIGARITDETGSGHIFELVDWTLAAEMTPSALPCGPATFIPRPRWRPAASGGPVDGWYLRVGSESGRYGDPVALGSPAPAADGTRTQVLGGLPLSTTEWSYWTMLARGPGGESALSNELAIAPSTSGECPPPGPEAPGAPQLLEQAIEQGAALQRTLERMRPLVGAGGR